MRGEGKALRQWRACRCPQGLARQAINVSLVRGGQRSWAKADLRVDTTGVDVDHCAHQVILKLESMGLIKA